MTPRTAVTVDGETEAGHFLLSLILDLPPVENHLYATVNGHRVKSKAARDYAEYVAWEIRTACIERPWEGEPPLELTILLFLKHDRDVSGNKCLQDALATALGFDDKIIRRLVVEKRRYEGTPHCLAVLRVLA